MDGTQVTNYLHEENTGDSCGMDIALNPGTKSMSGQDAALILAAVSIRNENTLTFMLNGYSFQFLIVSLVDAAMGLHPGHHAKWFL